MAALVLPHWSIYMYLDVFSNQKKSAVVSRFHVLPVFLWSFECVLQTFYVPVLALHGTFNSICQDDFRPIVRGIWICRRTRNDANYEVHSWHRAAAVTSCMSPIKRALVLLRIQTNFTRWKQMMEWWDPLYLCRWVLGSVQHQLVLIRMLLLPWDAASTSHRGSVRWWAENRRCARTASACEAQT